MNSKREVYKNVDLDKLSHFLNAENFFLTDSNAVPGFIPEKPHIDAEFWKEQILKEKLEKVRTATNGKNTQASERQQQAERETAAWAKDLEKLDLNVNLDIGKKVDFQEQQQQYLQSQHPFLAGDEKVGLPSGGNFGAFFNPVQYSIEGGGALGKSRIIISISKRAIRDKRVIYWLENQKTKEMSKDLMEAWEQEHMKHQKRIEQRTNNPRKRKKRGGDADEEEDKDKVNEVTAPSEALLQRPQRAAKTKALKKSKTNKNDGETKKAEE